MLFRSTPPVPGIPDHCTLIYRPEEYSFDTVPKPLSGGSSIVVNDLNLEIDDRNRITSIWGLCPHPKWKRVPLSPPSTVSGGVSAIDANLPRGVSARLNPDAYWPVFADPSSGWVKIEGGKLPSPSIEIFAGFVLQFDAASHLAALWLRPQEFPDLLRS